MRHLSRTLGFSSLSLVVLLRNAGLSWRSLLGFLACLLVAPAADFAPVLVVLAVVVLVVVVVVVGR